MSVFGKKKSDKGFQVCTGEGGMTLLELMFAAGVLALALSMLFGSLVGLTVNSSLTQSRSVAVTHGVTVMEELKALSFDEMLSYQPPTFGNLGLAENIQVRCQGSDGSWLTFPVDAALADTLPNPLTVQCMVTWNDQRASAFTKTVTQEFYR